MGGGRTHICFDVLHLFEARAEVGLFILSATTLFRNLATAYILSPGKAMLPWKFSNSLICRWLGALMRYVRIKIFIFAFLTKGSSLCIMMSHFYDNVWWQLVNRNFTLVLFLSFHYILCHRLLPFQWFHLTENVGCALNVGRRQLLWSWTFLWDESATMVKIMMCFMSGK